MSLRVIATLLAALALASFLFPFFAVTYDGRPLIHFTGLELVLGTTFRRSFEYGGQAATPGHVAAEITAMLAVAALACSVVLSWLRSAWANFAGIYTAMASWALILFLEGKMQHTAVATFPNTELERAPAWWTALIAAGALTIVIRRMAYARLRERLSKEKAPAEAGASQ